MGGEEKGGKGKGKGERERRRGEGICRTNVKLLPRRLLSNCSVCSYRLWTASTVIYRHGLTLIDVGDGEFHAKSAFRLCSHLLFVRPKYH